MANVLFYKYDEGMTDDYISNPINIAPIFIDNVSVPEVAMSGDNYFSVEGRTMTISFFSEDGIKDELINNKVQNTNSLYSEVLNIFARVYNDSNELLFSGVVSSEYTYDDYNELFTNIVLMDGLHCFIKYHLANIESSNTNPHYINNFPSDSSNSDYGKEVDLETLPLYHITSKTPLKRYYYIYLNGLTNDSPFNKSSLLIGLDIDKYDYNFPMRITNPEFEGLDTDTTDLEANINPYFLNSISIKNIAREYFGASGKWYPIRANDSSYQDRTQFLDNWDNSIEQPFIPNGDINPKYFIMKKNLWTSFYMFVNDEGDVRTQTQLVIDHPNDTYKIRERWFVYSSSEVSPISMGDPANRDRAYLYQKLVIKKLRFVDEDGGFWFDNEYNYEYSSKTKITYAFINQSSMTDAQKRITTEELVLGKSFSIPDTLIKRLIYPSLWRYYLQAYVGYNWYSANYDTTTFHNNLFSDFPMTPAYTNENDWGAQQFACSLIGANKHNLVIEGTTKLSQRAISLSSSGGSVSDVLKAFLVLYNISIISDNEGSMSFIKKLRGVENPTANVFELADYNTRSYMGSNSYRTINDSLYDQFFFSQTIRGILDGYYRGLFNGFSIGRTFEVYKSMLLTEPEVSDIILYDNKRYWINSIKLSDNYMSYILKGYEVL